MNINTLFKLVGQGEGVCLDFKRDLSDKNASRNMTKLMAAFANTEGGVILFGVEDNGDVIGVSDPDKIVVSLADYARNNCQPALYPQFETLPLGDGKSVVCVSIARQQDELCLVKGKCHIRIGSQSQTAEDLNEISRIYARLRGKRAEEGWEAGGGPAVLFTPVAPPSGKGFKGREEQLKFLSDCLDSKEISIVVIEGISGIGKSALSGQFALHVSKKDYSPCWITCHPETTFDRLSFELSGFARAQGFDEAADLLEESRGRFEDRIIRIASALARCRCALFLDDFHLVADPKVNGLLRGIEERSGLTKVFLTARRRPSLASQVRPIGLAQMRLQEGLDPDSCEQLLRECGLGSLDRATAHRIWELSGNGHPKALEIFAGRAHNVPIEELLSTLPVFRDDLKEVWLKPLLEELPEQQRAVVVDLSVFDRPVPLSSLPLLYPDRAPGDLEEIRRGLIERFILDFVTGGLMQMHPLIRDYCYDSLLSNRQELHEWAGFFYQQLAFNSDDVEEYGSEAVTDKQVENGIAAWSHFVRAGEHERATKIIGQIREPLLTSGQYDRILFLIEGTKPSSEIKQDYFAIDKARIRSLQGDKEEAVALLMPIVETASDVLAREAVLVLATVYIEHRMADEAVELLQSSQQRCLTGASPRVLSRFLRRIVEAYLLKGDTNNALKCASQMLTGCEIRDDKRGGAVALRHMAASYQAQKELTMALGLSQSSFELLEEQGIAREAAISKVQIALILHDLHQPEQALEAFEDALQRFTRLGDRENSASCRQGISSIRAHLGAEAAMPSVPLSVPRPL